MYDLGSTIDDWGGRYLADGRFTAARSADRSSIAKS
jgi:hypothetical protein